MIAPTTTVQTMLKMSMFLAVFAFRSRNTKYAMRPPIQESKMGSSHHHLLIVSAPLTGAVQGADGEGIPAGALSTG